MPGGEKGGWCGGREKKQQLECSLVAAGHRWSNMDQGLMQEVCVSSCMRAYMCARTTVCSCGHACERRRGTRYWVNTDQSLDISRYMCVCENVNTCMQAPACVCACLLACRHVCE